MGLTDAVEAPTPIGVQGPSDMYVCKAQAQSAESCTEKLFLELQLAGTHTRYAYADAQPELLQVLRGVVQAALMNWHTERLTPVANSGYGLTAWQERSQSARNLRMDIFVDTVAAWPLAQLLVIPSLERYPLVQLDLYNLHHAQTALEASDRKEMAFQLRELSVQLAWSWLVGHVPHPDLESDELVIEVR